MLPGWVTKGIGGAEWQLYILSEELLKNGWSIEVITNSGLLKYNNYYNQTVTYHYLKYPRSYLLYYLKALQKLFITKSYFYYVRTDDRIMRGAALMIAFLKKRKVIYALSGDDELLKNTYLQYQLSKKMSLKRIIKILDALICDVLIRFRKNKIDLVLTQTLYQQKELLRRKGLKSVVIPNSYRPSGKNENNVTKENIVLWVGNMRGVKRPEIFFKLAKKYSALGWEFIIIGEAGDYDNMILENSCFVKYLGPMNYEETDQWFGKGRILVNTSRYEGFPNTFLQAWFNGVLILSLDVNPDGVFSENNMGLFAGGDIHNFENMFGECLNFYENYSAIVANSNDIVRDKYSIRNTIKLFEKELNCLI